MADPSHSLPPPPPLETLAEKLDYLFRTVHSQGRGEYTYREVASGIRAQGGPPTLSAAYLWQLRTGQSSDPRRSYLEAIARFFEVPVGFFFEGGTSENIGPDLQMLSVLRDTDTRQVAVRANDLSREAKAVLLALIDLIRRLEGVPERLERRRGRPRSQAKPRTQDGSSPSKGSASLEEGPGPRRRGRKDD